MYKDWLSRENERIYFPINRQIGKHFTPFLELSVVNVFIQSVDEQEDPYEKQFCI